MQNLEEMDEPRQSSKEMRARGTIFRCLRMLMQIAESEGSVTVGELARQLDLAPSTTHRLLNQFKSEKFVTQEAGSTTYRPGPAFVRMASLVLSTTPFQETCEDALTVLRDCSSESAFFATLLPDSKRLRFVSIVRTLQPIQYVLDISKNYSLLFGASGRVVAAYLEEDIIAEIYDREAQTEDVSSVIPPLPEFLEELARIRQRGYDISSGQRVLGAHSVVAPVFGSGNKVVGSIGVAMPIFRSNRDMDTELLPKLFEQSERLSSLMGGVKPKTV
jgi:DNA-binding IclR family transcriptional regulator